MPKLRLQEIIVEDRLRQDLGDVEELANSIKRNGLFHPPVVTKTENGQWKLVAGGRRMAALQLLGWEESEFTELASLSPAKQRQVELEENIKRKSMSWQEETLGIAEYHTLARREAIEDGESWSQDSTGRMLGVSQASVSLALMVAKRLREKDETIWGCENFTEALKRLATEKLIEANKVLLSRMSKSGPVEVKEQPPPQEKNEGVEEKQSLLSLFREGDCLELLPKIANERLINHIITDPPYGIDMANMAKMTSIENVASTHQVEPNLELIESFLRVSFDCIAKDGFLCMWYDLNHHEKIAAWASKIGWKVCRWPLVWCKLHTCINTQAQYNITKATEVCYFLRRSELSVLKQKQPRNWVVSHGVSSSTHPFVKPFEVWSYLINSVSTEQQLIVDPFCGEGSMLAAALRLKRIPLGIEIEPFHIANGLSYVQQELTKANLYGPNNS